MNERVECLPHEFTDIRDEYLSSFSGKNLGGLNVDRVKEYFEVNGLDVKPYIVVTPGDLEKVHKIDTVGVLRGPFGKDDKEGLYSPEMGISIILRNPNLERQNGPAYTEGLIVHEGAHSTADITCYLREKGTHKYHNARVGLALPQLVSSSGFLLEEGWADMHRGNYLGEHYEDGSLDPVRETTGWVSGPDETLTLMTGDRQTPLPFKYLKVAEDGRLTSLISALAGFTVELLVRANPRIYPAIVASRTSVKGLRDFAKEVEGLRPDLYSTLRRLKYDQEDFTRGLHMVIDDVSGDLN